jgi:hypothetical protein
MKINLDEKSLSDVLRLARRGHPEILWKPYPDFFPNFEGEPFPIEKKPHRGILPQNQGRILIRITMKHFMAECNEFG